MDEYIERLLRNNPYKEVPRLSDSRLQEISEISRITQVSDFSPEGDSSGKSLNWSLISKAVLIRDNYACRICGKSDFSTFSTADQYDKVHLAVQVHHITPRKSGGKNTFSNLITLCENCHRKTFSNDYSGLPVSGQTTIYRFEKNITLCVRQEWLRNLSKDIDNGELRDYARAFDQNGNRYRVVPRKGESVPILMADFNLREYREICEAAHSEASAIDYVTMYGYGAAGKRKIRFFVDPERDLIL